MPDELQTIWRRWRRTGAILFAAAVAYPTVSHCGNAQPAMAPEPYRDAYLNEDDSAAALGPRSLERARIGRRFLEAELVYYDSDNGLFGGETETGLATHYRHETLNFGQLDAQLIFSGIESDFFGRDYDEQKLYFTFRQSNAPLANGWSLDNTAGHQRTLGDPFLHSGYRVRLPTSMFAGASMTMSTGSGVGTWYLGNTGDNIGISVPQFRENGGKILGGSWRQPLDDGLLIGAEVVNFKGGDMVRNHTSLLLAGAYTDPDGSGRYDVHLLVDNDANAGLWADGSNELWTDLILRYGAFYLQPDLAWMDSPIVNDQYGIYVRADGRTYAYNWSVGYDYTNVGVGSGSLLDAEYQTLFFNGNYRFTRRLSAGVNGNLSIREFGATNGDTQVMWRLGNFWNYRLPTGLGRFEIYSTQLDSDFRSNDNDIFGVRLSYEFDMPQGYRLTADGQLERQSRDGGDTSRRRVGVLFRQSVGLGLSWGVNASLYDNDYETFGRSTGIGVNADARWQFLPDWYASLAVVHNESAVESVVDGIEVTDNEFASDSIWLRLGYARATGQSFQRIGRNSGSGGAGRIAGEVFYDENGDSIRQPDERSAIGVVVVIDGRFEALTDARGRYEFNSVYSGSHSVSIISADLPLPWGLLDDEPQRVNVRVRQTATMDFALTKIGG